MAPVGITPTGGMRIDGWADIIRSSINSLNSSRIGQESIVVAIHRHSIGESSTIFQVLSRESLVQSVGVELVQRGAPRERRHHVIFAGAERVLTIVFKELVTVW